MHGTLGAKAELFEKPTDRDLAKIHLIFTQDQFFNHCPGPESKFKFELQRVVTYDKLIKLLELFTDQLWTLARRFATSKRLDATLTIFSNPLVNLGPENPRALITTSGLSPASTRLTALIRMASSAFLSIFPPSNSFMDGI